MSDLYHRHLRAVRRAQRAEAAVARARELADWYDQNEGVARHTQVATDLRRALDGEDAT